jgi:PAS domain S-box-containing protein
MRFLMKNGSFSLYRWVPVAFETVILILLVVGASAYRAMVASNESDRWVSHTHEVLEDLGSLQIALESIESGYRGFVLTGQESFLKSYDASILDVKLLETMLFELTNDNPRQKPRLLALEALAGQQVHFAQMVIGLRRTQGMQTAADAIRNGEGEQLQDELKKVVRETRAEELALLGWRNADAKKHLGRAKSVVILGIVLALLMDIAAVWSVKREIRARGAAEKGVLEGEERFRDLANNISQLAWMADERRGIFWYNQRWFDYTGTTLKEMAGWGWEKVHHPDHRQRVVEKISRCFRTGEVWEDTFPLRGADGNYRWFLSRAVPIRDPGGNVLRWFGTNTDITERLEAERFAAESKLRESEASFHHLADAMPQIVFTTDAEGGLDYYNQRWYDYTGLTFEQTKEWGWRMVLHPDDLENCLTLWTGALKARMPMQVLYRFKRASDNTYRWHLGQSRPIRNDLGVVVSWFGTCTDIEDYKQAEMQIRILNGNLEERVRERTAELDRANVRLEQSNRELQDFASVASHDLQEPLRKVQAFGDRLKTACSDALDEKGRDSLDRMLGASKRMQSLIQDLLSFARVTSQARPFLPVDLAQVTREVLSDLEIRIAENRAVVEMRDLPVVVADGLQMRQLLQNLIGNALKFHRPGNPPSVRVYTETADETLRLIVEDDGIGFDEKYLDRIFTVFQRLHGRSEYEGTGIGLAICRKIAQRHGGDITAISAPGKGAKFMVSLPCPSANENRPPNPATQADMNLGILKLAGATTRGEL